jgi:hypothetical protein
VSRQETTNRIDVCSHTFFSVENLRHIGRDDTDDVNTVEVNTKQNNDVKENIEPDGFILVKGKKKRTSAYVEKMSTNSDQNKKIVSWLLS